MFDFRLSLKRQEENASYDNKTLTERRKSFVKENVQRKGNERDLKRKIYLMMKWKNYECKTRGGD